ncbi:hypothetical protein REPUB_Repub04eG0262600 [Reevesia pubescens]
MNWQLENVSFILPENIVNHIRAIPIQLYDQGEDTLNWKGSSNGDFSLKQAYVFSKDLKDNEPDNWKWIWKSPTLPKIQHFIWILNQQKLATKSFLKERGLCMDDTCPCCEHDCETINHLFRNCREAIKVWRTIRLPDCAMSSFHLDFPNWLRTNCKDDTASHMFKVPWNVIFMFTLWALWIQRNNKVFRGERQPPSMICEKIRNMAVEFFACAMNSKMGAAMKTIHISWEPPPEGGMKINTDGSSIGNPGPAGAGGLIRDYNGNFLIGFSRKLGITTSMGAELWAIRDALKIAFNHGFSNIWLETDSQVAIHLLTNCFDKSHILYVLLHDCRCLMDQLNVQIKHTYREGNCCADMLAKNGVSQEEDFVIFENAPECILTYLLADRVGIAFPRICNTRVEDPSNVT